MTERLRRVSRALISVSDKSGVVEFARSLAAEGVELISTGGTRKALADAGLPVLEVSEVTGFPEMMDGRVKTLHPKIHGGLLAIRDNADHAAAMRSHDIAPIDLLVVSLYPFEATVAKGADFETCIENIDIGGPAMIRAAAKNHAEVAVVVDPSDYAVVLAELRQHGGATTLALRRKLAAKAYARTGVYDTAISNWFADQLSDPAPAFRAIGGHLVEPLRYGENPHQSAAFYRTSDLRPGVATARQVQGKKLSYNNINDTDAAYECVAEFDPQRTAACVIVKHANPCGVALGATIAEAYRKAFECDSLSAFGGVVALNRPLDEETAEAIGDVFTEVVLAPSFASDALETLAAKKNLRLLECPPPASGGLELRRAGGGFLVQEPDPPDEDRSTWKVVTKVAPTDELMDDLAFAMKVCAATGSNAIVLARGGVAYGIGAGQQSRVHSAEMAAKKADGRARGGVCASDAFFPFRDGVDTAVAAGAAAIVQPGGSVSDDKVIAAADEAGVAMVFTGRRHFRH